MSEPIARVGYLAGLCQYTGSGWVKSNLLWGYNAQYVEVLSVESTGEVGTFIVGDTVDPGEIWIVTGLVIYHEDPVARSTILAAEVTPGTLNIDADATLAQRVRMVWSGMLVLVEGDYINSWIVDLASGVKAYLSIFGYKMKLDM